MLRKTLFALCLIGLASTLAGCSGSSTSPDDDDNGGDFTTPYTFAGRWTFARTVTEDPVGWSADDRNAPLGTTYNSTFQITVNGTAVVANDLTAPFPPEIYNGTVNPTTGALTAMYRFSTGGDPNYIISNLQLQAETDTRMTGTWVSDEHPSPGFPNGKHMKHTIVATRN